MASAIRNFRQRRMSRRQHTLERLLRQHDAQLHACKRVLRDELPALPESVSDEMEQSVEHLARAVEAAVVEVSSSAVRGIESALRRLRTGGYGRCADCGARIAAARLRVLPFAERCRECQGLCDSSMPQHVLTFGEVSP